MVRTQGPRADGDRAITPRDRLLSAVALSFGYLRCGETLGILTPEEVIEELRKIHTAEAHPFIRTHTVMALSLQAVHHFELVASLLMELISEVTLGDRLNVVSVFAGAYLKQREELTGGDGEVEIAGRTYPIWTRTERPLTPIEISLYSWLRAGGQPVARQVAAQTFAAIAATELDRKERSLGAGPRPGGRRPRLSVRLRRASSPRFLRRLSLFGHAAVFLAAPHTRARRSLLRPVMAEVMEVERSHRAGKGDQGAPTAAPDAAMIITRWRSTSDGEVRAFARSLGSAFKIFLWRWVLILSLVFCAVLWYDWREWSWSNADPLPPADTIAIQQRKAAPLRLARNAWIPLLLRFLEDIETRRAAPGPAGEPDPALALAGLGPTPVEPAPVEPPARDPSYGPTDHLRRSATITLERLPKSSLLAFLRVVPMLGMKTARQIALEQRAILAAEARSRAAARIQTRSAWNEPDPEPAGRAAAPPEIPEAPVVDPEAELRRRAEELRGRMNQKNQMPVQEAPSGSSPLRRFLPGQRPPRGENDGER
jgi:hypothetical protein